MTAPHSPQEQPSSADEGVVPSLTSDSDTVSVASFQNLDAAIARKSLSRDDEHEQPRPSLDGRTGTGFSGRDDAPGEVAVVQTPSSNPPGTTTTTTHEKVGPPSPALGNGPLQQTDPTPEDQRTKFQTFMIIAALCTAVFLAALDVTITTVAIPTISSDFDSNAGYTWIGSAYLLANAAAAPSWGKMSDIFGRKPVLLTAVGVFWIGSLICGLSVNMGMLIVGRAVQGIGGGGTLILVNISISDMFSVRKRGVYLGFVGLTWAVAGGFGPVLGGVFTTEASWRWCFYVNLPVSGIAFFVLWLTVKLHNPRTPLKQGLAAVDWLGTLTIVSGTLMFLLGLELGGGSYHWNSPQFICLIIFGLLVVAVFIFIELKMAKFPVVPVRLFKTPRNLAILALNACHGFVFISASYYMPLYFQGVIGANALMSGVYILPFTFVLGATSAMAGFFIKKTGKFVPPIIGGFALMTLGYGLFIDLGSTANWAKIICFQMILGMGVGPNFQSPLIALQSTVQPRDIASATGTFMFIRQLSTSISIVVGGVIFSSGMATQADTLRKELPKDVVYLLTGSNAESSVTEVQALPEDQRVIAQGAYWNALRTMFIFYVAFAALGFVLSFFIGSEKLTETHTEHKTGLNTLQSTKKVVPDEEKGATGAQGGVMGGGGQSASANNEGNTNQ